MNKRIIALMMAVVIVFGLSFNPESVNASTKSELLYNAVKSAYGGLLPVTSSNEVKYESKKNIFGKYYKIAGVSLKYVSNYKAYIKSNSSGEYILFVAEATSKKNAKKAKKALKNYVKGNKTDCDNYYSKTGKKVYANYKVGRKGKCVYLFMLDSSSNSKAVNAFKNVA
ncbi:MAG: DUF4358 domain-containing protein [Lachnospiraceae bacterium]|nr:DUF4358 domain-containing protein [Lachnospiraceae bacterium]